ncbi:ABC transporter ATP-binding protein [Halorubrum ezzemoulense]|uniref:ABC transporter ATP-binding protein n=2 Tax=Halorubrum ezzemoulense TaxID=337243 RepID=A0ABT4Z661_HALEZ|nr:ABC transporter ATP-binding protein [Halorubrum ezzemoulense]MDB2269832.1 ABC transporter ATP-binding protein [Halorubrum ezzemoulense]MDB2293674.1 ABC transporter ATP-binding protein [Halorubrum ezzemoulense]
MSSESQTNSMSDSPIVQCTEVVRTYTRGGTGSLFSRQSGTSVTAVDAVSMAVQRGELVGLAGPSGSGKSTLLHLLAALETPDTGNVAITGMNTSSMGERGRTAIRRDHVGIVFQRFHLLPSLTALQNVALPMIEQGSGKRERRRRAQSLLEDVGLGDRLSHRPAALSGGEQQRVAVARALGGDPDLVIADEPTGELDSTASEAVLDLLADVAADHAVVVASHDPMAIDRMDRVLRLRDGRLTDG